MLCADYVDWPLWCPSGGPLREDALPLSESTKLRRKAWFSAYDEPPRRDWPVWKPPEGLSPEAVEQAWVDEGEGIRRILEVELGHPVGYETYASSRGVHGILRCSLSERGALGSGNMRRCARDR